MVTFTAEEIAALVGSVPDPELPALTIGDLGMVQDVDTTATGVRIVLTPTFIGCPAVQAIEDDIRTLLVENGVCGPVDVELRFDPPWTTDWMSEEARAKLSAYGIAPPATAGDGPLVSVDDLLSSLRRPATRPACPRCGSADTDEISPFGSAACRAQWRCTSCLEPFDLFKTVRSARTSAERSER
jgi:ring-1,2-phenylacetyl-CoA epoxidase subunit PaaD